MWHYAETNLIVVYSAAAFLTALGTLAGWISLGRNGWTAFAASPSTFVRASRGRQLDAVVRPRDTRAAAPLPDHVAEARVHFVPVYNDDDYDVVHHDDDGGRGHVHVMNGGGGSGGGGGRSTPTRWAITLEGGARMVEHDSEHGGARRRSNNIAMKSLPVYSPVVTPTTYSSVSNGDRFEQFQESWEGYSSQYDTGYRPPQHTTGYHPPQHNTGPYHSNQYGSGGYHGR
jgi:hypothetical protein